MTAGPVVLAAGGTGGHLFPAEALARVLMARGRRVALFTDDRGGGYADRFAGAEVVRVRSGTPSGRGAFGRLVLLGEIAAGIIGARTALKRMSPAAVVGFGGYPALPTMIAATRLHLATVIHEQNAVLGRVNRLLVRRVSRIALSMPQTRAVSPADAARAVVVGNPVRPAILGVRDMPYQAPAAGETVRLLVTGGSQGARIFSDVVPAAIARLPQDIRARLSIVQQARAEDLAAVQAAYADLDIAARVETFIRDMPEQLAAAHLCITRAGASTVAELAAAGRPSILVPYLHAMDDHQTANAEALSGQGAALLRPQQAFTAEALATEIEGLITAPGRLAGMAEAAKRLGRVDAADRLADLVEAIAGRNGGSAPSDLRRAA